MVTRCNLTHCAWREMDGLRIDTVDPRAWRRGHPLRVTIQPAGDKGLGVYAAEAASPGRWVLRPTTGHDATGPLLHTQVVRLSESLWSQVGVRL